MARGWRVLWVVTVLLSAPGLGPVRARAGESGTGAAAAPPPDATHLSVDDIGKQVESVSARLRSMTAAVSDDASVSALENQVFRYRQRVSDHWTETDRLLAALPRRTPLEALASSWRTLRAEIVAVQEVVDGRAHQDEDDLHTLDRLGAAWSWTLDHARRVGAQVPTVARIEATLAAIGTTRAQVEQHHARLLVLQDGVSQAVEACDDAAARLADARHRAVLGVFARHELPIWKIRTAWAERGSATDQLARVRDEIAVRIDSLRTYTQAHRPGFVLTLLLGVALALALGRAGSRAARDAAGGIALRDAVAYVVRAPVATAFLFTIMCSRPLRPDPPLALQEVLFLIGLPLALVVLRASIDARLAAAFHALVVFLVVDVARELLSGTPVLEQVVLIVEMAIAAALLFWLAEQLPTSADALALRSPWLRGAMRNLFRVVAVGAIVALVAAALGYLELADLVGGGGLSLVYLAIALLAIRVSAGGVIALGLMATPLARLRTVEQRGALGEYVIGRVIDVAAVTFWVVFALQRFELLDAAGAAMGRVFDARIQMGALDLSVGHVVGFLAVVLGAWIVSRVVLFTLEEDVYPRLELPRGVPYALSSLTRYGLLLTGFLLALATLGLDLTHLTVLVSAFGLGIGFGMQQIVNNFVSGLILLFERPVQVGDSVQLGDLSGHMLRIGIRASTIRTFDGAEVIVPNAKLAEERVTNWTLSDRRRRVDLVLRVAQGTEAERVLALLVEVAKRDPRVMAAPEPEALLTRFGKRTLEFQLRVWTEEPSWMRLRSDLGVAIQSAIRDAQIATPGAANLRTTS